MYVGAAIKAECYCFTTVKGIKLENALRGQSFLFPPVIKGKLMLHMFHPVLKSYALPGFAIKAKCYSLMALKGEKKKSCNWSQSRNNRTKFVAIDLFRLKLLKNQEE